MKKTLIVFAAIFAFASCATNQSGNKVQKPIDSDIAIQSNEEEEEYDIIIDDPAFDSWLLTNGDPHFQHDNEYYHNWNQQYVSYWNSRYQNQINYDYNTDYGYEVNYKLFHFFQFMQARYSVDLPGRIR